MESKEMQNLVFKPAGNDLDVFLVAAMGQKLEIGQDGQMPWHLPEDLRHFKSLTLNSCVIMGRRTFESIGCLLPQRRNIVVSAVGSVVAPSKSPNATFEVAKSMDEALKLANEQFISTSNQYLSDSDLAKVPSEQVVTYDKIAIIGGAGLYQSALKFAKRMELTEIGATFPDSDTFFPEFRSNHEWVETKLDPTSGFNFSSKQEQPDFRQELSVAGATSLPYRFVTWERVNH